MGCSGGIRRAVAREGGDLRSAMLVRPHWGASGVTGAGSWSSRDEGHHV